MVPEALARGLTASLLACACVLGCSRGAGGVTVTWTVEPTAPVTGTATLVRIGLLDGQQPVRGARLQLEAHMSHPGMPPITVAMVERDAGAYEARVQLTMAGAWAIVVTGELADGTHIIRNTDVTAIERADSRAARPGT